MIHPAIYELADRYGVKIEDRDATKSWIFDGKSIATYYTNPHKMSRSVRFTDHDILHEIGHYVAAKPEQKDLPEYGLSPGIVVPYVFGGPGGPFMDEDFNFIYHQATKYYEEGVVDDSEQETQEQMAQLLSCVWGKQYGLSVALSESSDPLGDLSNLSWKEYLQYKIDNAQNKFTYNARWEALFRLKEMEILQDLREIY